MLYPTFSNWYNERMNSYMVAGYVEEVSNQSEEIYEAMFEAAREYNSTIVSSADNFISGEPEDEVYIDTLDVLNGMIGYVEIDKIGVRLAIYHGTDETTLQTGVGHLEGSQLPTGDIGNNTVLTGHTGLPSADLFTGLTSLEIGDTFEVIVLNEVFTYEVFEISVVEPTDVEKLLPIEGKDVVTLVTCTPYGVNSHRLLVQGEQIEVEDAVTTYVEVQAESTTESYLVYITIPIIILLLIIILILSISLRKAKKDEILRKKEENRLLKEQEAIRREKIKETRKKKREEIRKRRKEEGEIIDD